MLEKILSKARHEVLIAGNRVAKMRENRQIKVEFKADKTPRTNADLMVDRL